MALLASLANDAILKDNSFHFTLPTSYPRFAPEHERPSHSSLKHEFQEYYYPGLLANATRHKTTFYGAHGEEKIIKA
jgi:hypothetical protein